MISGNEILFSDCYNEEYLASLKIHIVVSWNV